MRLIIDNKEIQIEVANTYFKKLKGLLFKKDYKRAMLFKNTSAIHTFGMKFEIDIIYLDQDYRIIKIIDDVKPNKVIFPIKDSKHIIEIDSRINPGNNIVIKKTS